MDKKIQDLIFNDLTPETKQAIDCMAEKFKLAVGLVARLRGPNGCPWDREQDHISLRQYFIEETYEALDVIDQYQRNEDPKQISKNTLKSDPIPSSGYFTKDANMHLCEELGDVLLQVLLHAQLSFERKDFDVGEVAEKMVLKLVHRHPHVFGDVQVSSSDHVLQNWEQLKKKEGKKSILSGLPKAMPSLQRAARIGEKAHRVGFDWKDSAGAREKVKEEYQELQEALNSNDQKHIEHELGDLFFALCNLSRHLDLQPEDVHSKAISRFEARFAKMEEILAESGKDIHTAQFEELDRVWSEVKKREKEK